MAKTQDTLLDPEAFGIAANGNLPTLGIAVCGDFGSELTERVHPEPPHPYRAPFVRDRSRILHSRAFRRLAGKTQVFTRGPAAHRRTDHADDHFRSRLTHTLEVAQISRTVAAALGLNADLAETLSLAHDIGHPPFGHAGEKALDGLLRQYGLGFDHNRHALRIVTHFEERYAGFPGLNLTLGVREGIVKHSRDYPPAEYPELAAYFLDRKPPLEAQLIDLADEIAYLTADIEDGLESGILNREQLRDEIPLFAEFYRERARRYPQADPRLLTNEALNAMLNAFATDLIEATRSAVQAQAEAVGAATLATIRDSPARLAVLSPAMEAHRLATKQFLYRNLYLSSELAAGHAHAAEVVETLFTTWTANPTLLPADHRQRAHSEGIPTAVADYIAGMTDSYIEQAWMRHNHP